jgi:DUF4097 and DUF4098 domain-containing protein YvlB
MKPAQMDDTMQTIGKYLLLFLLTAAAVGCNATEDGIVWWGDAIEGSGTAQTDVRGLPPITGVKLSTIGVLTIEIGDRNELRIEADDNLLQYFVTKVDDGILTIKPEDGIGFRTHLPIRYTLTVPALSSLRTTSSGDIVAPILNAEHFEAECSSSGDIRIKGIKARKIELKSSSSGDLRIGGVRSQRLEMRLSSSGDCRINDGNTQRLEATLSSSGDLDVSAVKAEQAIVRTSSSGDARVWVTERLRASSSSSGDILYRGDPRLEARESSSGDIRKL